MSAMTTDVHITPKDLGTVPRPVALVICELVNNHGVTYRIQKGNGGGHVFLYNGDTQTRPFKISGSRQAEDSMGFLEKWIRQNVPAYFEEPPKKDITPADVAKLAAVVNTVEHEPKADKPKIEIDLDKASEWKPFKFGFETDGATYRCTYDDCGYERDDPRGLHLHEYSHNGRSSQMSKQAAQSRVLNVQQKETLIEAAVSTIAEQFGLVVLDKNSAKHAAENERLMAENKKLKQEVEDLKARVALITEALKA